MSEKKNFGKRTSQGERRSHRNSLKNVKVFVPSCDTVDRNSELEQTKSIQENVTDTYLLTTKQSQLPDVGEPVSCHAFMDEGCNFSASFKRMENIIANDECKNAVNYMEEFPTPPALKSSQRVRHLPFKTISPATIANISKKINKLKEEIINFGPGSTSALPKSDSLTSKKSFPKNQPNLITLPKEHMKLLQERIKSEIQNLKHIERVEQQKLNEEVAVESDDDDDVDFEDLGSDIQFLTTEEREKILKKVTKIRIDKEKLKPGKDANSESLQTEEPVIIIDLTKESSVNVAEKTEMGMENEYPSLDLDYGSKINWDDTEKPVEIKDSIIENDKPTVNLNLDESKLTVETSKKITDLKNRLSRSLSIGLSHKKTGKKISDSSKEESKSNIPAIEGEKECLTEDAETLEWASLRCTSERTEVIADRERRRKRRCADYPGLAFGFSIFSSDTMMKFNIIRNELHNIMNTQLKRVGIGLNFML